MTASAPPLRLDHPRYEAGEALGQGAQGHVLRVRDRENPGRALVAKVLRGAAEGSLDAEFALLARLRIEGLARAHDLARDTSSGVLFLVEDFIDGPDAARHVAAEPTPASKNRALARILADLARTLGALHEAGFVHGDLKPEHARVTPARTMLLDLGAAIARTGDARPEMVTRAYGAPEVLAGGAASPSADLFGLGALAWGVATGRPPRGGTGALRDHAPWVAPSLAATIEALLAAHPADRPRSASEVLARLGACVDLGAWQASSGAPAGRAREWAEAARNRAHVLYVTGPSGAGKSHLVRELVATTLLEGRPARALAFPSEDGRLLPRLTAFFRGERDAFPFHVADGGGGVGEPVLLVLDDLDAARPEVRTALEALRCRGGDPLVRVVATCRRAPRGAITLELAPLAADAFEELAVSMGVPADEARALHTSCEGLPGWLVAARGRVPLTRDTALARTKSLSTDARDLLAVIALLGGEATRAQLARSTTLEVFAPLAELARAGLVSRRRAEGGQEEANATLASPGIARDLAAALSTYDLADRAAEAALGDGVPAATLLSVALCPTPPRRRAELLAAAATRARATGARSDELDALLASAADPAARTAPLLLRLERLTRDLGAANAHPQVLVWLDALGDQDASVRPLALRRRAEAKARAGAADDARATAALAREAARARGDAALEALSLATAGAVALFRADWPEAERALIEARSLASAFPPDDPEELARLDHNLGVVLLYRNRHAEAAHAFERALAVKRALGDSAGCRACLLNLGLAWTREGRFEEAERALTEATLLAESLEQTTGRAWTLAARADLEIRRRRPRDAERFTAEAEASSDALPPAVRADLALLRAEIGLEDGDGRAALAALDALDTSLRADDALIDARAHVLTSRAFMAMVPPEPRRAARAAVAALRRSREAALAEQEAAAAIALTQARTRARSAARCYEARAMPVSATPATPSTPRDAPLWAWLVELGNGAPVDGAGTSLALAIVRAAGAERAFVAVVGNDGAVRVAWGADLDGLPLQDAKDRIDAAALAGALRAEGPLYQRNVEGPAGTGSRLAIASRGGDPRAVVVVEHRFAPARFDGVDGELASRWGTMASVLARTHASSASPTSTSGGGLSAVTQSSRMPVSAARELESSSAPLREARREYPTILGESRVLRRALARLDAAVDSDLPVLLTGETGTGKEVFARALHDHGARAGRPFVAVDCASLPDALFEAELFGHARGSFTGAERPRAGLFARAGEGTLFLDEVGELPLQRQASLLRVLETRRFRAVGSDEEQTFCARVVAATNRDLEEAVRAGTFRQDLLYRLRVLDVTVPALRARADDIPMLAAAFLARAGSDGTLAPDAVDALTAYAWPGNVRELLHHMQRLAAAGLERVEIEHLPRDLRGAIPLHSRRDDASRESRERAEVTRALAATGGNITHAAARLGLTRHGLKKRMLRLGMRAALPVGKR